MTDSMWYLVSYFIGLVNAFIVGWFIWKRQENKFMNEVADRLWQLVRRKEGYKSVAICLDKASDIDRAWFAEENIKLLDGAITLQEFSNKAKFHNIDIKLEK